jgi:hypothetical protein
MLNLSEAIKEFELEVEFKVNQITNSQLKTTNPQQQVTVTTTAAQNTFRPATLQVPLRNNIPNTNRSQSPPGAAPTKNEVDGLVDKMLQLRLNHVAFEEQPWSFQFNDREAELMNNPVIQAEVRKRTEERSKDLQPYLPQQSQATRPQANSYQAQNQGQNQYQSNYGNYPRNNNQGYQNPNLGSQNFSNQGYSNANQGYQSRPLTQGRLGLTCWVCDKSGHQKNDCPTLRGFIDNGWCYIDERSMLNWGTPNHPQGRVSNLGNSGWAHTLSAEIKRRFLKYDADPLKVKSEWLGGPPAPAVAESNAISIQLEPDSAGALSEANCARFWRMSDSLAEDEEIIRPNIAQCNNTVAAAVVSRGTPSHNTGKVVQGPSRIQKPPPKILQKQPSVERIPHLKGHKNREGEFFSEQRSMRDTAVHFAPEPRNGDVEMRNAGPAERQARAAEKGEHREKYPKKHRLAQKLEADPHNVVQRVLDTQVQMPLKTLIGNMPEVKKRLFQASYTPEEFEGLSVTAMESYEFEEIDTDSDDGRPRMTAHVSSLALGSLPDYVLVEATGGVIQECYSINAEHWSDPEISHVESYIQGEEEPGMELGPDSDFKEPTYARREYDKAAGVEHLRRECPKVPIDIRGTQFLSLLDSGAELNTMRRSTAEKAMLPITSMPKSMRSAKMISANGSTEGFAGIVWGVPITIGRIEIRTNFFILEHCTNPIILGNPFLTDARARIEYATNGLTYCRIFSEDGENSTRFVCTRGNRINAPGLYAGPLVGNARGM